MAGLPPFPRTTCDCAQCTEFCHTKPGMLIPADLFRIPDFLISEGRATIRQDLFPLIRASKGAIVGKYNTQGEIDRFRIGTITPAMKDGRCIFLTEEDRCNIHAVSPFGCAFFDDHMDRTEGDRRSMWGLVQISQAPAYQQLRQLLIDMHGEPVEPLARKAADTKGDSTAPS